MYFFLKACFTEVIFFLNFKKKKYFFDLKEFVTS